MLRPHHQHASVSLTLQLSFAAEAAPATSFRLTLTGCIVNLYSTARGGTDAQIPAQGQAATPASSLTGHLKRAFDGAAQTDSQDTCS